MQWFAKIRANTKDDTVTILKTGVLNINASAYAKYFQDSKFKHVIFGYDVKTKKVALKLVAAEVEGAYQIRVTKRGATVSARAFLKTFGIEHATTRNYRVEWDKEFDALTLEINEREAV